MSGETSARLGLPMLAAGQAQKETTHNEALALIDLAVQACVVAVGADVPPAAPVEGACWILGAAPAGAWAGHARALAGWTGGGWRFVAPREGMTAWSTGDGATARFVGGSWRVVARGAAIAPPTGGATVDSEARTAVQRILAVLVANGLIAA